MPITFVFAAAYDLMNTRTDFSTVKTISFLKYHTKSLPAAMLMRKVSFILEPVEGCDL